MKCEKCKIDYPEEILSQMFVAGKYTKSICGICALELMNTGLPKRLHRTSFYGEMAEYNRQMALEVRDKIEVRNKK